MDGEDLSCYYYPLRRKQRYMVSSLEKKKNTHTHTQTKTTNAPYSRCTPQPWIYSDQYCSMLKKTHVSVSHVQCQKGWGHGKETHRRLEYGKKLNM